MEKNTAQIAAQARALRSLCGELAHGAAREAFIARVDDEIATLNAERIRLAVVALDGVRDGATAALLADLGARDLPDAALVLLGDRRADPSAGVAHAPLASAATAAGVDRVCVLADPRRVFGSAVLLGRVLESCDLVLLAGPGSAVDDAWLCGLRRLSDAAHHAVRVGAGDPDPLPAKLEGLFREMRACVRESGDADLIAPLARLLSAEQRANLVCDGGAARLALCADLLNKHVQADVALLKFRVADMARIRRGEDLQEAGGDPREQAETLKGTLAAWTDSCKADLARIAEQGVLPFDPRLLANKLTIHDLMHREEKSPAVIKYPVLGMKALQSMITHTYTVVPDPGAMEQLRQRLGNALVSQSHKDVDTLNQRAQELANRLRANVPLYPLFGQALANLRVPTLDAQDAERPIASITLETEAEDKFVHIGFFKRLMEGRMVASMAFSFLTMTAGVFVLFGEPNIKRGLMKFSGVIVIMMVLYFIFSMLVKGEEEKKELEEVLERVRARINQDVMRPLGKVQAALLKLYGEFVEDVAAKVLAAVEGVSRGKAVERARLVEQRKAEDEVVKAFFGRRQPAAMGAAQKTAALVTALERLRADSGKPAVAVAAMRPAAGAAAAGAAPAAGAAATAPPGAATAAAGATPSLAERAALARAQALERVGASAAAKPMSASERLAAARAQLASRPASPATPGGPAAAPDPAARPLASTASAAPAAAAATPATPRPAGAVVALTKPAAEPASQAATAAPDTAKPTPSPEPLVSEAPAAD